MNAKVPDEQNIKILKAESDPGLTQLASLTSS